MFDDGAIAHIAASMATDETIVARLDVVGANGRIEFTNPLAPQYGAVLTLIHADGQETVSVSRKSTYAFQLEGVLDALARKTPLPTEGATVLLQQETLDAIYAAAGLAHLRKPRP